MEQIKNEGIEAMIRHALRQYIPAGWHISTIEEVEIEGKVAPRFISSRLTEQGWEPFAVKVVALFVVETKPELEIPGVRGKYKLYLMEDGKLRIAESVITLPPPSPKSTTLSIGALPDTRRISWITPGYQTGWGELTSRPEDSGQGWIVENDNPAQSAIGDEPEPVQYTLKVWRIKAHYSRTELADAAGIDYKTMTRAELVSRPIERALAEKIVAALLARFEAHPEYARWEKLPETPEDVKGWTIQEANSG